MDWKPKRASAAWLAIAIASSSLALFFGTGLHPHWWLTWLMPFSVLLLAGRLSARAAFLAGMASWCLGSLNTWTFLRSVLEVPLFPVIAFMLLPSCVFGLGILLFRRWVRGGNLAAAALGFCAFWVSFEYLVAKTSIHGTYGNLAYSQMDFLPILQIATLTGGWGISFLVLLPASTIAALWSGFGTGHQKSILATAVTIFLLAIVGFGEWRLHAVPNDGALVRVGLLASDLPENTLPTRPEDAQRLMREYAVQARSLLKQGAQVVVAPEKIVVVQEENIKALDTLFAEASTGSRGDVVVGVARRAAREWLNEARVYTPGTSAPLTYEKQHMLPPFETRFTVGTTRTILQRPSGLWGVTICKDMDFPLLSREYGRENVGLLLVPAWDFDSDGWLHGRMAILRGIENGFSIARTPRHGVLTISDNRGRVLAEKSTAGAAFATILGTVPVRHEATLYSRVGDWFAWCCVGLFLALLLLARPRLVDGKGRRGDPA